MHLAEAGKADCWCKDIVEKLVEYYNETRKPVLKC